MVLKPLTRWERIRDNVWLGIQILIAFIAVAIMAAANVLSDLVWFL